MRDALFALRLTLAAPLALFAIGLAIDFYKAKPDTEERFWAGARFFLLSFLTIWWAIVLSHWHYKPGLE